MPTRSGKPYKDSKKKKAKNKDIVFDNNTTIEKDIENNLNISNISSNRELKTKKHKVKRSVEKATESNWIVSDLTEGAKQKHSQVNTSVDNGDFEPPPEADFTTSSRKLRNRKISITEATIKVKKNKAVSTDAASTSINTLEVDTNSQNILENNSLEGDNDLGAATLTGEKMKKKKNKKKKNHIIELSPKKPEIPLDTTFEKVKANEDMCILSIDTKVHTAGEDKVSPVEDIKNTQSNDKDNTFKIKEKRMTRQSINDNRSLNIKNDVEGDFNRSTSDSKINHFVRKTSGNNILPIEPQDGINNTTYDKDQNTSIIIDNTTADSAQNNEVQVMSPICCLRIRKSVTENGHNTTEAVITNKKDEETKSTGVNITAANTRKAVKNLKEEDILTGASPKNRKRKIPNDKDDKGAKPVDTTYELHKSFDNVNSSGRISNEDLNASNITNKKIHGKTANIKRVSAIVQMDDTITRNEGDDETSITSSVKSRNSNINMSYDKNNESNNKYEKDLSTSFDAFKKGALVRKSGAMDSENNITPNEHLQTENILSSSATKRRSFRRRTLNINDSDSIQLDSTFDAIPNTDSESNSHKSSTTHEQTLNTTFDKNIERDSKSSLISSDNSVSNKYDISQISVTSDDTEDNIINTTPMLVESIIDESKEDLTNLSFKQNSEIAVVEYPETPMKREGTFTKDGPEVHSPKAGIRVSSSVLPTPGCTPYRISKSSQKKPTLNVTRSIEKKISAEPAPRMTRVMFCSPVDNPVLVEQEKRKIIKSNLKGSKKSFIFDEDAVLSRPARKRSYTHNDVESMSAKRSRLTDDLQNSVNRLSRPRTTSATGTPSTPKKLTTPSKSKSESKPVRTRLPNFGALHQKEFAKMESLDEYHERKVKRARQILTTSGSGSGILERVTPKSNIEVHKSATKDSKKPIEKTDTPSKKLPTLESLRPGYTKFGFKLNLNINPFSIPPKTDNPQEKPTEIPRKTLPSLTGTTAVKRGTVALRREAAKNAIMREKSNLEKRSMNRSENRTIIKGVRTNRRFELQMKLRNIN